MILRQQKGFSLIEFSIYLMILCILFILSFQWSTHIIRVLYDCNMRTSHISEVAIGFEVFDRDIKIASQQKKYWKKQTTQEIIWHNGAKDIGWCFTNNEIRRSEGKYDVVQNRWHKRKTSLIAKDISACLFEVQYSRGYPEEKIIGVSCNLQMKPNQTVSHSVMIRNGMVIS